MFPLDMIYGQQHRCRFDWPSPSFVSNTWACLFTNIISQEPCKVGGMVAFYGLGKLPYRVPWLRSQS